MQHEAYNVTQENRKKGKRKIKKEKEEGKIEKEKEESSRLRCKDNNTEQ